MPIIFTWFMQLVALCVRCVGVKLCVREGSAEVLVGRR